MKVTVVLLCALLSQCIYGMANHKHGATAISRIVSPLQKMDIAIAKKDIRRENANSIPTSIAMSPDDVLIEPLTKGKVLQEKPWCNVPWCSVTSSTVITIFEKICHPILQTDYRNLRIGLAAALYAGVDSKHEFMAHNFFTVVAYNDTALVKLMLNKVDAINDTLCGVTPIFFASNHAMARTLQLHGARMDRKITGGRNLLHNVLCKQYDAQLIYDYMCDCNDPVDPEDIDDKGLSSLDYFTKYKSKYTRELANEYLLSFLYGGVSCHHPFIEKYFVDAIADNDTDFVEALLDNNVNANAVVDNQHAIFYASTPDMADRLCRAGADLHIYTEQGNLIHNVLKKKYDAELIPYYAEHGVPIDETDLHGLTPLDCFCESDYSDEEAQDYLAAFLMADISEETIAATLRKHLSSNCPGEPNETSSDHTVSTSTSSSSVNSLLEVIDE